MLSKSKLLIISGLASVVLFVLNSIGTYTLCGAAEYGTCMDFMYGIILAGSPMLPLFLLAVLTYFTRMEIYVAWFRFARIWMPLSMLAIVIAPDYSSDWMYQIEKGTVAAGMSVIFVLVSLLIIARTHFRTKN